MHLPGTPYVGLAIRLYANTAEAEDRFLYHIFSISLAAAPGTPYGRLLGGNSAYWPSRLLYYLNNLDVQPTCQTAPLECLDHVMFIAQALQTTTINQ